MLLCKSNFRSIGIHLKISYILLKRTNWEIEFKFLFLMPLHLFIIINNGRRLPLCISCVNIDLKKNNLQLHILTWCLVWPAKQIKARENYMIANSISFHKTDDSWHCYRKRSSHLIFKFKNHLKIYVNVVLFSSSGIISKCMLMFLRQL